MARVREGVKLDHFGVCRRDLPAHLAGDEAVRLPVDEEDGDGGALHGLGGVCVPQADARVQPRRQPDEGADDEIGKMYGRADSVDDRLGGGEGRVRDDAAHIGGQVEPGRHEDRRRAHGDAREDHGPVLAEALPDEFYPPEAVIALLHAVGDGVALAAAVGAMLDEQNVAATVEIGVHAGGEVPHGRAPVAVKADDEGSVLRRHIQPAPEPQPVRGGGVHCLERDLLEPDNEFLGIGSPGLQLRETGYVPVDVLPPVGGVEHSPVDAE